MRRLDRYILREILYPTLIGLLALTFVILSRELARLLEVIVRQSATPAEIWAIAAAFLPNVLTFTLPMSVLVGILTGFGRLSADSETIALRAAGVPMRRILAPVLVLGISAWLVNMVMTAWVAPEMAVRLDLLKREIVLRVGTAELQPRVFNEMSGYVVYFQSVSLNHDEWRGVMLANTTKPNEEVVSFASTGVLKLNEENHTYQVTLTDGNSHTISNSAPQKSDFSAFTSSTVSIPFERGPDVSEPSPISEASTGSLWRNMRAGNATDPERMEFHKRFALPFACIAFALVGFPLGVSTTRGSKSMGLVLSLILMFVYYLAFVAGTGLARDAHFSPLLGAWLPNVAFLLMGIVLMARADREHQNYVLVLFRNMTEWLAEKMSSMKHAQQRVSRWFYSFAHRSKMFRVLDRYVLRGFCFYFTMVLVVFITLFVVVTLFELLPDIVRNHIDTATVVYYFIFFTPQILYYVVPLTVLLAILINLGTLTKANEILAVKAAGMSLYRLSLPLLFMGLVVSSLVYLMQDFILPGANKRQDEYHDTIKGKAPQTYQHPDRKWMAGSGNRIYHYTRFDYGKNLFGNLSVFQFDPDSFKLRQWTFAPNARWVGNGWKLENVAVRRTTEDATREIDEFPSTLLVSDMDTPEYFKDEVRTAPQMTYNELSHYVEELEKKQFDVTSLKLELYRKLSFPLVSFIMVLIGIPFSFKTGKRGAFYGIGLCIGLGIFYWSTMELFDKLGDVNRLSPMIAAWFPNLIFGLGGMWMMLRVKT